MLCRQPGVVHGASSVTEQLELQTLGTPKGGRASHVLEKGVSVSCESASSLPQKFTSEKVKESLAHPLSGNAL